MIQETNNNHHFRTANTALAAYLIAEGFGNPDIEYENNGTRAFFLFNMENPKIEKHIQDWDTARAKTNVVLFFNAYQNLLRRIRERY